MFGQRNRYIVDSGKLIASRRTRRIGLNGMLVQYQGIARPGNAKAKKNIKEELDCPNQERPEKTLRSDSLL